MTELVSFIVARTRDYARLCDVPVLVMTTLHDGKMLKIVQQLGGDGLLQKPLHKQSTLSMVSELTMGRRNFRQVTHPDGDSYVLGEGVVSPTLRRLLQQVAKHEQA